MDSYTIAPSIIFENSTRNPSPPPLTEEEKEVIAADYIGDSLFSKKWVLAMLLKLYKLESDLYDHSKNENKTDEKNILSDDLCDSFEHDVSALWDMTANADVAEFICDNHGIKILLHVFKKTTSPRLMEISFGILGNLVCVNKICVHVSSEELLRKTLLEYLTITDSLSLVELSRCLISCLSNRECVSMWLEDVLKYFEQLIYILQNSLNDTLVSHIVELVDMVFDESDVAIETCTDESLFTALEESYKVLIKNYKGESIASLVHILQLVSTSNKGVVYLTQSMTIAKFLCCCVNDYEKDLCVIDDRNTFLTSIYSVLTVVISTLPDETLHLLEKNSNVVNVVLYELFERTKVDITKQEPYLPVYLDFIHELISVLTINNFPRVTKCLQDSNNKLHRIMKTILSLETHDEWKVVVKRIKLKKYGIVLDE